MGERYRTLSHPHRAGGVGLHVTTLESLFEHHLWKEHRTLSPPLSQIAQQA